MTFDKVHIRTRNKDNNKLLKLNCIGRVSKIYYICRKEDNYEFYRPYRRRSTGVWYLQKLSKKNINLLNSKDQRAYYLRSGNFFKRNREVPVTSTTTKAILKFKDREYASKQEKLLFAFSTIYRYGRTFKAKNRVLMLGIYDKIFRSKSVRKFTDRKSVIKYLEKEVFHDSDFLSNVSETAKKCDISYVLAFEIVSNYLTDILFEIDQAISSKRKKKIINVYSYFFLQIGFMVSVKNKKMFLEKYVKPKKRKL
jgi:hypothetical protein